MVISGKCLMKTRTEKVSDVFLISVDRGQRTALERSFESQCRTNMEDAGASGLPAFRGFGSPSNFTQYKK